MVHAAIHRVPMAIHCPFPGTERRRPVTRSPISGLLLAGDWTRTGLPSSMEGAVMSGWRAAEQILAEIGQPRQLAIEHNDVEGFTALVSQISKWLPKRRTSSAAPAAS